MEDIKRIDIKEFREFGFLQEINRQWLHPLGLALEVVINDDGTEELGGIWDYREDDDGMRYSPGDIDIEKIKRVTEFQEKKFSERKRVLGYIIQERE